VSDRCNEATRCNALSVCRELVLTGNKLGSVLCSMLGKLLLKMKDLRRLYIDACEIDDGAAAALATCIMSPQPCKDIRVLAFGGNNMSPAGLSSIARSFEHCTRLDELDLSCTPISSEPPVQHISTGTSTTAMYDLLAALDHSSTASQGGPGPTARTISSGPGSFKRTSSAFTAGTTTQNGAGTEPRMLVWTSAMVRNLSVILKNAQTIRCNGCVWHGSALQELAECLRSNSQLQALNIRMNEKHWDPRRDMQLSKMLSSFAMRQAGGNSSVKVMDFGGFPTGKMNAVLQRSTEFMPVVENLSVTCSALRGDNRDGPDTLVRPTTCIQFPCATHCLPSW
jgi:hypothetical protein